jgi:hypothetical protein
MMKNKLLVFTAIILAFFLFIALILTPIHKKAHIKKLATLKDKGVIAIILDDWGYHLDNLAMLKEIKAPLTCAVLPNLKNSNFVAKELNALGCEIILHLPMEPKERYRLEKNTIISNLNAQQIQEIIDNDLISVAFAKGISNHMGSGITENRSITAIIMNSAKKHKLYFLDSFVTAKSICKEVATKTKVRFAKRDVFLDNSDDPIYIKNQLIKLKNLASQKKIAIGIGHDRKNTLLVLSQMLPLMEKEGYHFVFISQVVELNQ